MGLGFLVRTGNRTYKQSFRGVLQAQGIQLMCLERAPSAYERAFSELVQRNKDTLFLLLCCYTIPDSRYKKVHNLGTLLGSHQSWTTRIRLMLCCTHDHHSFDRECHIFPNDHTMTWVHALFELKCITLTIFLARSPDLDLYARRIIRAAHAICFRLIL